MSHLWQKLDVIKEILGTQKFCSRKKTKANQKRKQRFPSDLKISENLHIYISFFVYTKSVKEIFKKTTKGFEMRKQISSKLFYVPLNWEKNWNGTKMFWMKPECNKDFKSLLKSFNRYGNNTACHCFKPNTYFENNKPWSIYKT